MGGHVMLKSRQVHIVKTIVALFTSFLFLFVMKVSATSHKCADVDVTVFAEQNIDIAFACRAAHKTYRFLRSAGLTKQVSINLHIVSKLPKHDHLEECLGYYEGNKSSIYLLSYNACKCQVLENGFWNLTYCRALHDSFIVHEIAHAIAAAHFEKMTRSVAAQEYIPYTAQIALLAENLRNELLTKITNEGFKDEHEITSMFHDLSPSVFAVKAYRHFLRKENGRIFYQKILSGSCRLNGEE